MPVILIPPALYHIAHVKTESLDADASSAAIGTADYKHYVDDFNVMEPEVLILLPSRNAGMGLDGNENVPSSTSLAQLRGDVFPRGCPQAYRKYTCRLLR